MMDEQGTRFEVLVEDMGRQLRAVAEAVAAQAADSKALKSNFERLDSRFGEMTFEVRELNKTVSQVATKVDRLDAFATDAAPRLERLESKVDKLEAFATDAGPRLVRIETHLALPAPPSRRETTRPLPSKRHRRKPAKRT
jgi:predicted nuclease with TOPRIM domain